MIKKAPENLKVFNELIVLEIDNMRVELSNIQTKKYSSKLYASISKMNCDSPGDYYILEEFLFNQLDLLDRSLLNYVTNLMKNLSQNI